MVFPDDARASAKSARTRADSLSQKVTASSPATLALRDLDRRFAEFLDYAENVLAHTSDTRRGYKGAYGSFRKYLASLPPKAVSAHLFDIEGWIAWNRKRGLSPISVNTYFRALRPFFHDLERRDGYQNPYQHVRTPSLPASLPKARTLAECRHILTAAENYTWKSPYERHRAVAIIGVLLYAGLRRREVLRLMMLDVNLESGTIRVNKGKGRGGGKDRVVYIAPELREILARYLAERRRRGYAGPGFFASTQTGQAISLATFRRIANAVRRASGITFSVHSLRHSFVTMLLAAGVPIHVARELAGHSNITTTAGYLRVFDEDKRREIRKLSLN